MAEEERCQGCKRYVLPLDIGSYREHALCYQCIMAWQRLDETMQKLYGRCAVWGEYLHPRTSWFRGQIIKLEKSMLDELAASTAAGRQYIRH